MRGRCPEMATLKPKQMPAPHIQIPETCQSTIGPDSVLLKMPAGLRLNVSFRQKPPFDMLPA